MPTLDVVDVIGYHYHPKLNEVWVNGISVEIDIQQSHYNSSTNRLLIVKKNLVNIASGKKQTLSWSHRKTLCDSTYC